MPSVHLEPSRIETCTTEQESKQDARDIRSVDCCPWIRPNLWNSNETYKWGPRTTMLTFLIQIEKRITYSKNWLSVRTNLKSQSRTTASFYLHRLSHFCSVVKLLVNSVDLAFHHNASPSPSPSFPSTFKFTLQPTIQSTFVSSFFSSSHQPSNNISFCPASAVACS